MKRKVINENGRDKAFIGAAISAAAGLVGGIISGRKQKKAAEKAYRQQQEAQTQAEGYQQAAAMSAQYANQDYVDQYKEKIALKNGGKVSMKKKGNDRVAVAKKFRCGGRRKASLGIDDSKGTKETDNTTNDNNENKDGGAAPEGNTNNISVNSIASSAIKGIGTIGSAIAKPAVSQKQVIKSAGFNYGAPKQGLAQNSYQVDANGNPVNVVNTNPTNTATDEYGDRVVQAKMGMRKCNKCGGRNKRK